MKEKFYHAVATLHPAYFSLVMATGIVSTASGLLDFPGIAKTLFWLNVPFYTILVCLTGLRIMKCPKLVFADLKDHQKGMGFFTVVAGTAVLGNQFLIIEQSPQIAFCLWILAVSIWLPLNYAVFALLTIRPEKPTLATGINGGWLVAIVAAQSVSLLASHLSPSFPDMQNALLFFGLVVWLGGGMLYLWIMGLIFYRYTFFPMSPFELAPPYWINMGAMAISTLAGTALVAQSNAFALLQGILPFTKGLTLVFWATATWWIPLLLVFGVWRHLVKRVPLAYDLAYWSLVFPLGMYTVSTHRLAQTLDVPFLTVISGTIVYVAMVAWVVTLIGLARFLVRHNLPAT